MTSVIVPPWVAEYPTVETRGVTIDVIDMGARPKPGAYIDFFLACDLNYATDNVILASGRERITLYEGTGQITLPVWDSEARTVDDSDDWVIGVKKSWSPHPYSIRVLKGTGRIDLADLKNVRRLTRREQMYAITGVGMTVTEGTQAGGSAQYRNGVLDLNVTVPPFRPQTVYPYIDTTVQQRDAGIRADTSRLVNASRTQMDDKLSIHKDEVDDRLAGVADAYDVAVQDGFTGTRQEWLASLKGSRGEEGPYGGTAVTDPQLAAMIARDGPATRAALDTAYRRGVSADEFGVAADGATDDLPSLQAAVDAAAGGTLFIPSGTYNMSGPLTVQSGTTIYGEPGTELYVGSFAFQIQGEAGPEVAFGAHAGSGDRSITTAVPHGLAVGDTVRIISQRDALSPDAGDNWRLGYATPGAAVCYFSEFHQVMTVDSDTKVTFRTPILFPSYRADDTQEQYPGGRTTSIIQKIDTARSITIRDLSISSNYGTCIETRYAEDVLIESVRTYNRSRTGGASVFFRDSLNCRAVNVRARYSTEELIPSDGHQRRNTFKTTGTQNCGFDSCFVQNSSQCIDFTYDAGGTPSVFPYVTNCEVIGSQDNCATAHGGTYGAQFTNNRFIECRMNGILNRSRSAVITGNTVIGRHFDDPNSQLVSYGIAIYEGWARDCTVSGNKVHGFKSGITIWDARDPGEWFEWVGAVITGNVITGCRHGVFLHRSANNLSMEETGILIADNIIRASDTYGTNGSGIWVGPHYIGVVVQSNIINGMNNAADGIMVRPDAHYTRIAENRVVNFTAAGIRALGPTDPQIPVARLMPANNYYSNVGSGSSAHQVIGSGVEVWSGANTKPGFVRVSRPTTLEQVIDRLSTLGMWE